VSVPSHAYRDMRVGRRLSVPLALFWFFLLLIRCGDAPCNTHRHTRHLTWLCVHVLCVCIRSMSAVTSSFSIDEFGGLSREQLVYLARTAEASERFEGMLGGSVGVSAHTGWTCLLLPFSDAQPTDARHRCSVCLCVCVYMCICVCTMPHMRAS
jgi:hypothetical protein